MNFLKKIFKTKSTSVQSKPKVLSYSEFWEWFVKNESAFHRAVEHPHSIDSAFFDKLGAQLNRIQKECFYFLAGMSDDTTVELKLTADGDIKNIPLIEALVKAAPTLPNWKFTALKPALDIKNTNIEMEGHFFNKDTLQFFSTINPNMQDEISVTIIHEDCVEENRSIITQGTYLFLDNFLGELEFATKIDSIEVKGINESKEELIPIEKLNAFLTWREKEFIEKHEEAYYNSKNDSFSTMQAKTSNGSPVLALINQAALEWDRKASHPWIAILTFKYNGSQNDGLPSGEINNLMYEVEDRLIEDSLKETEGYIHICNQTTEGARDLYFACRDFRKPAIAFNALKLNPPSGLTISFEVFKDKYWQSLNRFRIT